MQKLSNLPDYSAIQKLAAALHRFGSNQHGAAIMIGAGFSRTAARHVGSDKKMPLWNAFSEKLLTELNPSGKDARFSDPLRVAEEYRAYFGQAALNDQIRAQIDDDAWEPSALYDSLLKLPWSEVMTTNWDTLLERAAVPIHGPYYTPVARPSDLAWAPSPRIVKLHGTIGTTDSFIATQEDFRTYPERFAPFVNFARQVFIENELCLLGFSGEDPNFLQWAGWVRDHLASHARKIYLVGALNLSAAQRVYLESINIAPVDLWGAVEHVSNRDQRHHEAISMFLDAMHEAGRSQTRPHEWIPASLHRQQITPEDHARTFKDHAYAAGLLKGKLVALQSSRESYPGWLVCPPVLRWRLQSQLNDPIPSANNIAELDPVDREKLLYEMAWRYGITFDHIPFWLAKLLLEVASENCACALSKRQQMEIALTLLKNSRLDSSREGVDQPDFDAHVHSLTSMLETHAQHLPDGTAELAYHKCLVARDNFDYGSLEGLIEQVRGEDPVWKLRKAALLVSLGRFEEGQELIAATYGELRRIHRRDLYSISVFSRLTWAYFLLTAARRGNQFPSQEEMPDFVERNFRKWKCDPRTWLDEVEESANKKEASHFKERNPIQPLFQQGHYRDNTNSSPDKHSAEEYRLLECLTREVGIPLCSGNSWLRVPLLTEAAGKLALTGGAHILSYTFAVRAAGSEDSRYIEEIFSRIGVANAPKECVETLVTNLINAIDYWREKSAYGTTDQKAHSPSALRVLIEVLSRLTVRVSPQKAKQIFRLALSIGSKSETQHFWLHVVTDHLLTHSLSSIPISEQGDLLVETLNFPLSVELGDRHSVSWPNPHISNPDERIVDSSLDRRIQQIIAVVSTSGSTARTDALVRLLPLIEKEGFLTETERASLADAIWGNNPDYQRLPATNLFPSALLRLPAKDQPRVESLIRAMFYEQSIEILNHAQKEIQKFRSTDVQLALMIFKGITNAALSSFSPMHPSAEQAIFLFDQVSAWRPEDIEDDFLGESSRNQRMLADCLGRALSHAIVPALLHADRTTERFEKLKLFAEEIPGSVSVIPALIYFTPVGEEVERSVEKIIQRSMQDREAKRVAFASFAIEQWIQLFGKRAQSILRLIARLIVVIESGRTIGLQSQIPLANKLLKEGWLTDQQIDTLAEAIPIAFNAAQYSNIDPKGQDAVSASSIRQACARLATSLLIVRPDTSGLRELLQASKDDPLPEVRFALVQDR